MPSSSLKFLNMWRNSLVVKEKGDAKLSEKEGCGLTREARYE